MHAAREHTERPLRLRGSPIMDKKMMRMKKKNATGKKRWRAREQVFEEQGEDLGQENALEERTSSGHKMFL